MDYQYCRDGYKGTIRETEFYALFPKTETVLKMYIDDRVRTDRSQDILGGYENSDKALCSEVDYIDQNGGTTAVNGAFDLDLKQVQSSGYTLQMGNGRQFYKGISFSLLVRFVTTAGLRRKGLLKLGWNW